MKKVLFFAGVFCCLQLSAQQQIDYALKNFQSAMSELKIQNLDAADSLLSLSIYLKPSSEAYMKRAQIRLQNKDYLGYCSDLYNSAKLGDAQADFLYKNRCPNYFDEVSRNNTVQNIVSAPQFDHHYGTIESHTETYLIYPAQAKYNNIQGNVLVSFIINEEGKTQNVMVVKGIGNGCDEEAVKFVIAMPLWIPAKAYDEDGNLMNIPYKMELNIPFFNKK